MSKDKTRRSTFAFNRKFYILHWKFDIQYFYGTGSYPCPPQGWQRLNRLAVSHNPLNTPCFLNASSAYCEQVGVNRHLGPRIGEMIH
jgi:hypothetical protein